MADPYVQHDWVEASAGGQTITSNSISVTAGNTLWVVAGWVSGAYVSPPTVGTTFGTLTNRYSNTSSPRQFIWTIDSASAATGTLTVDFIQTAATGRYLFIVELAGLSTYQDVAINSMGTAGSTTPDLITTASASGGTGPITISSQPATLVGVCMDPQSDGVVAIGSTFTQSVAFDTWGGTSNARIMYRDITATGDYEATATNTSGFGSHTFDIWGVAFTNDAVGSSTVINPFIGRGGGAAQPLW